MTEGQLLQGQGQLGAIRGSQWGSGFIWQQSGVERGLWQDCWGDQGKGHCGSPGEGTWGLGQVMGWGWREVKTSQLLSSC